MSQKKVFIAVLNQGKISAPLVEKLLNITAYCFREKTVEPTFRFSCISGIDNNRNTIARDFLKTECEWLLMIDEDNPPLNNPLELISLNKDVICFPTLMYKGDGDKTKLAFNVYKFIEGGSKTMVYEGGDKLFRADRVGTGCILIHRRVLEKIKKPFETKFNDDGVRFMGEDIYFSDKCREAGFELWGHWDYICSHYKTVDLLDIADVLVKSIKNGDVKEVTPMVDAKK